MNQMGLNFLICRIWLRCFGWDRWDPAPKVLGSDSKKNILKPDVATSFDGKTSLARSRSTSFSSDQIVF